MSRRKRKPWVRCASCGCAIRAGQATVRTLDVSRPEGFRLCHKSCWDRLWARMARDLEMKP